MRIVASILLSCILMAGTAQVPDLRFKYFSRTDGIVISLISHIAQDSTGYIWIAAHGGLYKYDGYGFTGYYSKQDDSTSLPSNTVNYLYTDARGRLWVATDQGICQFREEYDSFERITDLTKSAGLTGINISYITEDRKGNILVTSGSSIYQYREEERNFVPVFSAKIGKINHFIVDRDNRLWIACSDNQGLIRYVMASQAGKLISPQAGAAKDEISGLNISRMALEDNHLWMTTLGQGVKMLDISTGVLTHYPFNNGDDAMAINVVIDNENNIWTIDYTGLKLFSREYHAFIGYYPMSNNPTSVKSDIKGIFQDNQGNYWVYHEPGGVGISMQMKGFRHFDNDPEERWHTSLNKVVSILDDLKGNLWVGYHDGGLDIFDWNKGVVRRYQHDDKDKYSLGKGSTLCIFRDSRGTMWVCTYMGGLQYYEESTGKFIRYLHNPENPRSVAGTDIRSIAEDSDGNLWLAVHGKGVDKFDIRSKTFTHYNNANNKLSNDWTFHLIFSHTGDLWVATAWGLNCLKKGENVFTSYLSVLNDTTSLTGNYATALHEDNKHVLWVGTSEGLNRYNAGENNFTRFLNGSESNFISAIQSDNNNDLWISNLTGITKLNPQNGRILNFNTNDGLRSDEYNARAVFKNSLHELLFGGSKGIDLFNPEQLIYNTRPPAVIIDKIKILNKELIPGISGKLKKHISHTDKIILSYSDKVITLNFKALNFIHPQTNQYAYRLKGFEGKWNYVGTLKEATYTNLDPGRYVFQVIAANNDGEWNTKGAALTIVISPPWYGTLVFKITLIILIIALVTGFIALRTAKLNKQRIKLEQTIRKKTSELSEKNKLLKSHTDNLNEANRLLIDRQNQLQKQSDELKQQSASLAVANLELQKLNVTKDKLFSIIAHDLTSPFNSIIGFSEILSTHYDTLTEEEKLNYISVINQSSGKVYALLHSLLMWARSQTNRISNNPEPIYLVEVIHEALALSSESLKAKQITASIECHAGLQIMADLEMIKTIIRNLLNNAVKFTPTKGSIRFLVTSDDRHAFISVMDSGIGIQPEKIKELLSAHAINPEQGTDGETGSGLGLMLCKDFIRRNSGTLQISSEAGKGSTFTFNIPLAGS